MVYFVSWGRMLDTIGKPKAVARNHLFDENDVHSAMAEADRDEGLRSVRRHGAHRDRHVACPLRCRRRGALDSVVERGLPAFLAGFV